MCRYRNVLFLFLFSFLLPLLLRKSIVSEHNDERSSSCWFVDVVLM